MFDGLKNLIAPVEVKSTNGIPGVTFSNLQAEPWMFGWAWNGNKNQQLTLGYRNKIIYSVVNVLIPKLVEVPIIVNKETPDNKKAVKKFMSKYRYSDYDVATGVHKMLHAKAIEEVENHDLVALLEKPNDFQTGIELRKDFWYNNKLVGDGFLWAEKADSGRRAGQPLHLYSLPADRVIIYKNVDDWRQPVMFYQFTTWTGQVLQLPPEDVMHIAMWSPLDPQLGGWSPQNAGAQTILASESSMTAQNSAYLNGSTGIIISSDTGTKQDGNPYNKLTSDQVSSIKETVQNWWQGSKNNKRTHVVNGKVEVNKLGDTLADLELIEADESYWRDICAIYNIDPILVGAKAGSTESNVKAAYKALVTNQIIPDLREFDQKFKQFSQNWYSDSETSRVKIYACHDITEFTEMAPDLQIMSAVYGKPAMTIDEVRKIFGADELDNGEGKTILVDSNQVPLDVLVNGMPQQDSNAKPDDYS